MKKKHINKKMQFSKSRNTQIEKHHILQLCTISYNFFQELSGLGKSSWYGVVARVRSCEAKMCICDYSHPRLFQRHFSRRGKPWLQDQDQHFVSFCFFVLSEPSSSIIFHFAFSQKPRINQTKRTLDFACLSVCLSLVVWFYWTDKASFVSC